MALATWDPPTPLTSAKGLSDQRDLTPDLQRPSEPREIARLDSTEGSFPLPPRFSVNYTPLLREEESIERFVAGLVLAWLAIIQVRQLQELASEGRDQIEPSQAVERLRSWTGLSVGEIADLLGVARRSLYHWSTGATRPRREERLLGLVRALEPLSRSWEPWELRKLLLSSDPHQRHLLEAGDFSSLIALASVEDRPSRPSRLRRAQVTQGPEVEPLETEALLRHFQLVMVPRVPSDQVRRFRPRELTDSPEPVEP